MTARLVSWVSIWLQKFIDLTDPLIWTNDEDREF